MTIFTIVLAACLGACVGSFLGVVVWRVPRGESIVQPPSHCSECGHRLTARELVPIVSYVALQGRCRECGAEIPATALLIEVGAALVFAVAALLILG